MDASAAIENGLPVYDLAQLIVKRGKRMRHAEDRVYRREVAATAIDLDRGLRDELAKRQANTDRASGRGRAVDQ